jgi:dTMP kinase
LFQLLNVKERDLPGTLIVIEGPDGSGTSTQSQKLVEELDAEYRFEPTDEPIGKEVDRLISKDGSTPETVALSFAADRMVHVDEVLIPLLEEGKTVVCDRYYHSSLVYQPAMGLEYDWVRSLNRAALEPDITIVLDVSGDTAMERVERRGKDGNVFEDLEFQQEVATRYVELEQRLEEEIEIVDAERPKDEVLDSIMQILENRNLD